MLMELGIVAISLTCGILCYMLGYSKGKQAAYDEVIDLGKENEHGSNIS